MYSATQLFRGPSFLWKFRVIAEIEILQLAAECELGVSQTDQEVFRFVFFSFFVKPN